MAYKQLTSEKYLRESIKLEIKEYRRQRSRIAIEQFQMFVLAAIVVVGVGYAIQTMPTWMPQVTGYLEYYGVIATPIPAQ